MRDKKGASGDLPDVVITVILVVVFSGFLLYFIGAQKNGAGVWEDVYAKEIAQIIDVSKPGDEISIDVQYISTIAQKSRLSDLETIVQFDNENKEVIVKLRPYGETRFSYFNDVEIVQSRIELGVPTNILRFKISDISLKEKEAAG